MFIQYVIHSDLPGFRFRHKPANRRNTERKIQKKRIYIHEKINYNTFIVHKCTYIQAYVLKCIYIYI